MALVARNHRTPPPAPATGAGGGFPLRRLSFIAMATTCEVQYVAPGGDDQAAAFEREAEAWVHAFEARYSRFRPLSLVSRINAAAGGEWVEVDEEMERLLVLCDSLHFMTEGLVDPTALPLLRLWDWKAERPAVPTAAAIESARARVGWKKVQREPGRIRLPMPGMALDFGGFGKEYAVDRVAQLALDHGIRDVLVDFGHDQRALGAPPGRSAWLIGIEVPDRPGECWARLAVSGRGVASSGDSWNAFVVEGRRYGHIVDPRTGRPVANGCRQATAIASSCIQAGVLATTAFLLGVPKGIDFIQACPGAEGVLQLEKSRAQSRGFSEHLAN